MADILYLASSTAMPTEPAVQAAHGEAAAEGQDWSQWMRLAQAGDRAVYQRLLQAVVPYLSAIARSQLSRSDGVEDAVQDILMIVHRVRHTYEPERPFKPWLATIARRHCIDLAKRRQRLRRHEVADDALLAAQMDHAPKPDEVLDRSRSADDLRRRVAALPQAQRTALELMKLDELSLREASAASGLSIPALKVGVHRAVKSLRRRLGAGEAPHD